MLKNFTRPCEVCSKPIQTRGYRNHLYFKHGIRPVIGPAPSVPPKKRGRPPLNRSSVMVNGSGSVSVSPSVIVEAAKNLFQDDLHRQMAFILMSQEPLTSDNLTMASDYLKSRAKTL